MIECPYCERPFSSDGSYRVHKHRYHAGLEYRRPIPIQEETTPPPYLPTPESIATTQEQSRFKENSVINDDIGLKGELNTDLKEDSKDLDSGFVIIAGLGTIAIVILLASFGKK